MIILSGASKVGLGLTSVVEGLGDFVPIHDFPPSSQIVRPTVLVFEVIGVLPNIAAQNRGLATADSRHQGVVLVGG